MMKRKRRTDEFGVTSDLEREKDALIFVGERLRRLLPKYTALHEANEQIPPHGHRGQHLPDVGATKESLITLSDALNEYQRYFDHAHGKFDYPSIATIGSRPFGKSSSAHFQNAINRIFPGRANQTPLEPLLLSAARDLKQIDAYREEMARWAAHNMVDRLRDIDALVDTLVLQGQAHDYQRQYLIDEAFTKGDFLKKDAEREETRQSEALLSGDKYTYLHNNRNPFSYKCQIHVNAVNECIASNRSVPAIDHEDAIIKSDHLASALYEISNKKGIGFYGAVRLLEYCATKPRLSLPDRKAYYDKVKASDEMDRIDGKSNYAKNRSALQKFIRNDKNAQVISNLQTEVDGLYSVWPRLTAKRHRGMDVATSASDGSFGSARAQPRIGASGDATTLRQSKLMLSRAAPRSLGGAAAGRPNSLGKRLKSVGQKWPGEDESEGERGTPPHVGRVSSGTARQDTHGID